MHLHLCHCKVQHPFDLYGSLDHDPHEFHRNIETFGSNLVYLFDWYWKVTLIVHDGFSSSF